MEYHKHTNSGILRSLKACHSDIMNNNISTDTTDTQEGDICGDYIYYQSQDKFTNAPIIHRKLRHKSKPPELILDLTTLSYRYPGVLTILKFKPSENHNFVAFLLDTFDYSSHDNDDSASSKYLLVIKDIALNKIWEIDFDSSCSDILDINKLYIADMEWSSVSSRDASTHSSLIPMMYIVMACKSMHRTCLISHANLQDLLPNSNQHNSTSTNRNTLRKAISFKVLKLNRHNLNIVLEEPNISNFLDISTSKDGRFVIVHSQSKTSSHANIVFDRHIATLQTPYICESIIEHKENIRSFLEHANNNFFLATNTNHNNLPDSQSLISNLHLVRYPSQLCRTLSSGTSEAVGLTTGRKGWNVPLLSNWIPVWPLPCHQSKTPLIKDFDIILNKAVIYGRLNSNSCLHLLQLDHLIDGTAGSDVSSAHAQLLDITPQIVKYVGCDTFEIHPSVNAVYDTKEVRFSVSNPVLPEMSFSLDVHSGLIHLIFENSIKNNGIDARKDFEIFEEVAKYNQDDVEVSVPITMVMSRRQRQAEARASSPLLLIGYGAYGVTMSMSFQMEFYELLTRGWTIAFAHTRGGGELGIQWHADGKLLNKKNTFEDFASCAMHLIDKGYTNPSKLCGHGGSAGGLIMGYMANNYSHLFAGLVMRNPFLDIFTAMQDPDLPLTIHEYDEWGNPSTDTAVKAYMESYSPCSNVHRQRYPSMFISIGLMDVKVNPRETMKWISLVRDNHCLSSNSKVATSFVFVVQAWETGGHDGPRVADDNLKMNAAEITFLTAVVNNA